MKTILAIVGSAQPNSSNSKLVQFLTEKFAHQINIDIFDSLKSLPHFDAAQTIENPPTSVIHIREKIEAADAILISSPEYIFSIPSGLKNLFEWCVATTIFSDKPTAVIIASADGQKAFEELQLILRTLGASIADDTCLLINGVKGKFSSTGHLDDSTQHHLIQFMPKFLSLM